MDPNLILQYFIVDPSESLGEWNPFLHEGQLSIDDCSRMNAMQ